MLIFIQKKKIHKNYKFKYNIWKWKWNLNPREVHERQMRVGGGNSGCGIEF